MQALPCRDMRAPPVLTCTVVNGCGTLTSSGVANRAVDAVLAFWQAAVGVLAIVAQSTIHSTHSSYAGLAPLASLIRRTSCRYTTYIRKHILSRGSGRSICVAAHGYTTQPNKGVVAWLTLQERLGIVHYQGCYMQAT